MDNLALGQGGNLALASGALANGTTAGTIKTTVIIPFILDGRFLSKAVTDNIAISFTGADVYSQNSIDRNGGFVGGSNGSVRQYGLYLDSAGAVTIVPAQIADVVKLAAGEVPLQFAPPQKAKVCFGAMRVQLTSGTTFVPGTTALNAAGVTTTFVNLASVPAEPTLS